MTLASTAADVSVTSGAQAVQLLTGTTTVANCQPGELVTIALTTTSGAFEWQIQPGPMSTDNFALATGILGEVFGKKFYSPTSSTTVQFTMPNVPFNMNFFSEVTDGHNVLRSLWTIQSAQAVADLNLTYQVRGVMPTNVANPTAQTGFTVASTDLTFVQGDRVLLAGQTTGATGGIYEVGVVAAGTAPLTRVGDMPTGARIQGGTTVRVSEGTTFANTEWFLANAGVVVVGTTTQAVGATTGWFPRQVVLRTAMAGGTATISTIPIRALTRISVTAEAAVLGGNSANTTGFRTGVTTTGAEGIIVGIVGTSAIQCYWCIAAGTVNAADTSTAQLTISQQ